MTRRRYMYNTVNTNNVLCFRRATNGYESEFLSYIIDSNGNVSSVVGKINNNSFELVYTYSGNAPSSFEVIVSNGVKVKMTYDTSVSQFYIYKMTYNNISSFYAFTSGILSQDKIRIMKEQGFNIYTESALYLVDN